MRVFKFGIGNGCIGGNKYLLKLKIDDFILVRIYIYMIYILFVILFVISYFIKLFIRKKNNFFNI